MPLPATSTFDHLNQSGFALDYSHEGLACRQCHLAQSEEDFHRFETKGSTCVDCHQDVHQNYWGSDCEDCHSPENWNAEFAYRRHESTLFPLVGAHHSQACYLCHTSPGVMPSLECADCHSTDFQPSLTAHEGLNESADCSTCHGPTRWDQILAINHSVFFPIYSGEHRGRWNSCATCHTQSGDYGQFTCFGSGCHSENKMNDEHCEGSSCEHCDGLTYPRTSVDAEDCYFCHPRGNTSKCGD